MIRKLQLSRNCLIVTAFVIFAFGILTVAYEAHAAAITVSPQIIDRKAKPRDILKESVTLEVNAEYKMSIYASVNNIDPVLGKQEFLDPSEADHSTSLANWIKIKRGAIEPVPGRHKMTIDFSIEVNMRALPGIYHAVISFSADRIKAGEVMVNLEVADDSKEVLQLKEFYPDKTFFSSFPVSFSYILQNIGNRKLVPKGKIIIYNRKGKEVGSIDGNLGETAIDPNTDVKLSSSWYDSRGFGKYKARLYLEYGENRTGVVQDTIFFYILPWSKLLVIVCALIASIFPITYFLYKRHAKS